MLNGSLYSARHAEAAFRAQVQDQAQAQLNKTRAEIEQASARYEYQIRTFALRYETGELR
jgi:hypothetical protein